MYLSRNNLSSSLPGHMINQTAQCLVLVHWGTAGDNPKLMKITLAQINIEIE